MPNIEIISPGHELYNEFIDGKLENRHRFLVKLEDEAIKAYIRLVRRLSKEDLPHGAGLMLGYVPNTSEIADYFIFGVNKDISKASSFSLLHNYEQTLEMILERARSKNDHDGAFLITPSGKLEHSGSLFDVGKKRVYKAYGHSTYYGFKECLGIKDGGTRVCSASIHSLLFIGALFATISEKRQEEHNLFLVNGQTKPIEGFSLNVYKKVPPPQFYNPDKK